MEFNKIYEPIKPGDVHKTFASTEELEKAVNFKPVVSIQKGLNYFADWYVSFYKK